MNKNIKRLVESFFDDEIFNVENNIKNDLENIGEQYYTYKVGEYYKQNNSQFLCINNGNLFNDKLPRFLYTENNKLIINESKWSKICGYLQMLEIHDENYEKGYYATQLVNREYYPKSEPAFYSCLSLNENCYLPSIKELYYGVLYLDIHNLLKKSYTFLSSTQCDNKNVYGICYQQYFNVDYNNYTTNIRILKISKDKICNILPFYYPFT